MRDEADGQTMGFRSHGELVAWQRQQEKPVPQRNPLLYRGLGDSIIIELRGEHIGPFKQMVQRGLAFEHGEPQWLHEFSDQLNAIPTPTTPAGTKQP